MALKTITVSRKFADCPQCGNQAAQHSTGFRKLKDFGDDGVAIVEVEYSKHKCKKCRLHFSVQFPGAAPGSHYTKRVKDTALDLLRQPGIGLKMASEILMKQHFMRIPITTLHEWKYSDYPLAAGGKKDKEE